MAHRFDTGTVAEMLDIVRNDDKIDICKYFYFLISQLTVLDPTLVT
jgi:hypothetical protein